MEDDCSWQGWERLTDDSDTTHEPDKNGRKASENASAGCLGDMQDLWKLQWMPEASRQPLKHRPTCASSQEEEPGTDTAQPLSSQDRLPSIAQFIAAFILAPLLSKMTSYSQVPEHQESQQPLPNRRRPRPNLPQRQTAQDEACPEDR
jgi:hypothetical protein